MTFLDELLADDSTLGPKGGRRLGYKNLGRYITTELFAKLVRKGWVGSRGVTTSSIKAFVGAALEGDRSVVMAEEAGHVPGARRRAGYRR